MPLSLQQHVCTWNGGCRAWHRVKGEGERNTCSRLIAWSKS